MSSTNGVAVSAETLNKLNQFKQRAAQRKNLLQNSNASSDMVSNDLLTSTVASKQSVLPTPQFAKPQIQLNPAVQALKLTPKRRASIVIERKPPARRQPNRLKQGELVKVNLQTYRIESEIGSGGSCIVYKASDINRNEKHVALKIVDLTNANNEKIFRNEIQFLDKLQDSPYVIKMFDYQQVKNRLFVVMELGERSLKEQMKIYKENGRLNDAMLRYLWAEMCACVKVIHDLNIVHADLKPANFVLVNNMVKLIDFGIAAQIVANENTVYRKGIQGTLNYISPEAVNARPNGDGYEIPLKSDVWSLGCILFALVYGEPPFAHIEKQEKKIVAIMQDPIQFPKNKINPLLMDVLKRCLTRDLNQRPSVDDLLKHAYITGGTA